MSEELQEVITNLEWYRDLQYEDAKGFIQDNINNTCRSFVAIGYYLKYIRDNQMYTQDGCENIWDLAQAEFGISKSQASKFMAINDRFSKDGNSPILLDQYKDFSSSKLSEMLYLTDEQLEQVTPVTTVAEIREIRKPEEVVSTSKQEPVKSKTAEILDHLMHEKSCVLSLWRKYLERDIAEKGLSAAWDFFLTLHGCSGQSSISENGHPKYEFMFHRSFGGNLYMIELSWDNDKSEISASEFMHLYLKYSVDDEPKSDDIPETVNDPPETVDNQPETENDVDNLSDSDELEFDCYNEEEEWHKEVISDDTDPVETVEADIIQTVPEDIQFVMPKKLVDFINSSGTSQYSQIKKVINKVSVDGGYDLSWEVIDRITNMVSVWLLDVGNNYERYLKELQKKGA